MRQVEHPEFPLFGIKHLEKTFLQHPSLLSLADQQRVEKYRAKRFYAQKISRLQRYQKKLALFACSVEGSKIHILLCNAVENLNDSIWILKEAKPE